MIFGFLIVVVVAAVLWYTTRPLFAPVRAVERRTVEVGNKTEIELKLEDGQRYRSAAGIVWYEFPSGEMTDVSLASQLEEECDRLENLERWSHADEKGGSK